MSATHVFLDDVRNSARSRIVQAVVGTFVALVALLFLAERGIHDHPYRVLYDAMRLLILVGPLLLAPLAYLSIAGDRASGRIRYVMGMPNSRLSYGAGTFAARSGLAAAALVLSTAVGFVVAAATFPVAPDLWRFVLFVAITLLYVLSFVSIFVALSAAVRKRATAMFGCLLAYFVLVPFWIGMLPPVGLETLLTAVGDLLGRPVTETTRHTVQSLSPYAAYAGATEPVFADTAPQYELLHSDASDELYHRLWFNLVVLLAWIVVPLVAGYARFRRSELG